MILISTYVGYNKNKKIKIKNTSVPFTCPGARQLCRAESLHPPRHPQTAVALTATATVNEPAYTATEQEAAWDTDLVWSFGKKEIYIYIYKR